MAVGLGNDKSGTAVAKRAGGVNESSVLSEIQRLDQQMGSDNYLPLYTLRDSLPGTSRQEIDNILNSLQRSDRIELSSLHNSAGYTPQQLAAGFPQRNGERQSLRYKNSLLEIFTHGRRSRNRGKNNESSASKAVRFDAYSGALLPGDR